MAKISDKENGVEFNANIARRPSILRCGDCLRHFRVTADTSLSAPLCGDCEPVSWCDDFGSADYAGWC